MHRYDKLVNGLPVLFRMLYPLNSYVKCKQFALWQSPNDRVFISGTRTVGAVPRLLLLRPAPSLLAYKHVRTLPYFFHHSHSPSKLQLRSTPSSIKSESGK